MKTIKLGQRLKDKVTGLTGIATSRCEYLNGCVQFAIQPPVNEKGENVTDIWIDEGQLEFVDHGVLPESKPKPKPQASSGGGYRSHPS